MYVYIYIQYIHLLSCSFHGTNRTPNSHSLALEVIEQRKFLLQPSAASPAKAARSAWISKRSRGKLMVIWYNGDIMEHIIENMIYTIYIWVSLKIGHPMPSTISSSLSLFGMAILGVYPIFRHIQTCLFYSYMGLTGNMGSQNPLMNQYWLFSCYTPNFKYWNKTCNHWKQRICHVSSLLMALLPQQFCLS